MTKKDKKGVPTKTDEKTILEQVPSDKMDDFVKGLVELMEKKKATSKKMEEESTLKDVLWEPSTPTILTNSEEIDDEGNLIAIEPSNPPLRTKGSINER